MCAIDWFGVISSNDTISRFYFYFYFWGSLNLQSSYLFPVRAFEVDIMIMRVMMLLSYRSFAIVIVSIAWVLHMNIISNNKFHSLLFNQHTTAHTLCKTLNLFWFSFFQFSQLIYHRFLFAIATTKNAHFIFDSFTSSLNPYRLIETNFGESCEYDTIYEMKRLWYCVALIEFYFHFSFNETTKIDFDHEKRWQFFLI